MSEKEREEKLLQSIHSANGLKAQVRAKKADGTALIVITQENAIKKTFDKRFAITLDFDFFRHPVYLYSLREDLIIRLEPSFSEKVILCTGDTSATYKLLDISLEYDAIFDEPYVTTIGEMYTGTMSIPYTKVTSIYYQTLSKKDTTWKVDVNNLSVCLLQCLLLLFFEKHDDDFANKNEEFYNPSIKKILVIINGMPHLLFAAGLQARAIYPELKKYFCKENSDATWEDFLTTKFALWIDTKSNIDNTFHDSGRAVEKSGMLHRIKKSPETSGDLTCYVFSLEDAVVHLSVISPSGILIIEK